METKVAKFELKGLFEGEIARREGEPLNEWFERLAKTQKQRKLSALKRYSIVLCKSKGCVVLGVVVSKGIYPIDVNVVEYEKDKEYNGELPDNKLYEVPIKDRTQFFIVGKETKDYFDRKYKKEAPVVVEDKLVTNYSLERQDGESLLEYYNRLTKFRSTAANLVEGDKIVMKEGVFKWKYKQKAKYLGDRVIIGRIMSESYGELRGQHSFMIEVLASEGLQAPSAGEVIRRLGRNVYKNAIIVEEVADKEAKTKEKNERAEKAREAKYWNWLEDVANGKEDKWWKLPYEFVQENKDRIKEAYPEVYEKFLNKQ